MDFDNITFDLPKDRSSAIKVVGVGGGGSNAVNYMFEQGITGVDFVICNTDAQALNNSSVPNKIQLGASITEGLGAGANPEVGEQAALESLDDVKNLFDTHTKMVFITAGMGGGTGTGAAPIIANCAKEMNILTVGIVTAPFTFEGRMRLEQAKKGIEKLRNNVDSLIIINNDKLRELFGNLGYRAGFSKADEVLATAAKGIAEVITQYYDTNIDLRDARTVLADSGTAIMGSGKATGQDRASKAISMALDSPLLNDNKITGAKNVLLLIVSGEDEITMDEIGFINEHIQREAGNNANIIMGIGQDKELEDDISVTIIATGFPLEQQAYNGKEQEQIVHRLEDEQPLTKSLPIAKPEFSPTQPVEEKPQTPVRHVLDLEDEADETPQIKATKEEEEEEFHPILDAPKQEKIEEALEEEDEQAFEFKIVPQQEVEEDKAPEMTHEKEDEPEANQEASYTLFTLEDEEEEQEDISFGIHSESSKPSFDPKPTLPSSAQQYTQPSVENTPSAVEEDTTAEAALDPMDMPIHQVLDKQIKDRKERLKKFNFKFKSSLQNAENDAQDAAFQRKGVDLHEHEQTRPSDLKLEQDKDGGLNLRANSFLHDNVD